MLKKNQIIECKILRAGYSAEGIAEIEGLIVFVEDALPDELVEIKIIKISKKFAVGKLLKVLKPSSYRRTEFCDKRSCGGCQLTFADYEYQLELKKNIIVSAFRQNAKINDIKINPVIPADNIYHYRNKVIMPVSQKNNGAIEIGFYSSRSHRVVNIDDCKLQPLITFPILNAVKKYIYEYKISVFDEFKHKGIFRNLMIRFNNDLTEIMVVAVINSEALPHYNKFVEFLLDAAPAVKSINICINKNKGNAVITDKIYSVYGNDYISSRLFDKVFIIRPETFFQVNYLQTEKLYAYIRGLFSDFLKYGNKKPVVFDLYAGISSIGVCIAELAEFVYSIEENPAASKSSVEICRLNNINNLKHITSDSAAAVKNMIEKKIIPDIVIFDPPRKGCVKEELEMLAAQTNQIIYVSCNPATLARDARILLDNGFAITQLQPLDMFPNTYHIETICEFIKNSQKGQAVTPSHL